MSHDKCHAMQGPRCSIRSKNIYSDANPDYLKMTLLNLPAAILVRYSALLLSLQSLLSLPVTACKACLRLQSTLITITPLVFTNCVRAENMPVARQPLHGIKLMRAREYCDYSYSVLTCNMTIIRIDDTFHLSFAQCPSDCIVILARYQLSFQTFCGIVLTAL